MNFVDLIRYIVYGLTQGFFEVLPISSAGLVSFIQEISQQDFSEVNNNFFLAFVNLGSLFAVIIYLKKRIRKILVESYRYVVKKSTDDEHKKSFMFLKNIVIAILPTGIIGIVYSFLNIDYKEYGMVILGVGALLTGTILYYARFNTDRYTNTIVNRRQAWYIGVFQVLSILPGVSRLAVTTAAGTHRELSHETSLTFSLLIYIPISLGTIFVMLVTSGLGNEVFSVPGYTIIYYLASLLFSFIATMVALKYLFIITRKGNFRFFYILNLIFGVVALFLGVSQLN